MTTRSSLLDFIGKTCQPADADLPNCDLWGRIEERMTEDSYRPETPHWNRYLDLLELPFASRKVTLFMNDVRRSIYRNH